MTYMQPQGAEPAHPPLSDVIERNIQNQVRLRVETVSHRTFQERMADAITTFSGNMSFVYLHALWFGLWVLLNNNQIRKMISSYVGENKLFESLYLSGKLELELNPQGTLAERIRAGGAGIPAFYTKTGVGTVVAEGKPTEVFDGETYVRETWLKADLAVVKAWKGDHEGNLIYRKTARNFNPNMATAAKVTIAEVEELVPNGTLDPDQIHTPGIFVNRILEGKDYAKRIEFRTVRPRADKENP